MKKAKKLKIKNLIDRYKEHAEFLGMELLDINQPGSVDDTMLHIAARKGNIEDIYFLISVGANINAIGDLGNTPLHQAAMRGALDSVKVLLELNANPLIKNEFGQTAADVARIGKYLSIYELINEHIKE